MSEAPAVFKLRPYQQQAQDAAVADWDRGINNTLICLFTGGGKTATFLSIVEKVVDRTLSQVDAIPRFLILAHRQELIYQPCDRMTEQFPRLVRMVGEPGVVMSSYDQCDRAITVATIQTLSANNRLEKLLLHGAIDYLIYDEVHHACSVTSLDLIKKLKAANPQLRILGVTATPNRTDGDGLSKVFESCCFKMNIAQGIKIGALCPFTALGAELPFSIGDIAIDDDVDINDSIGDILSLNNSIEIIYQKWKEHAANKQTLGFTASVKQAHALADYFRDQGVNAFAVDAKTADETRKELLNKYKSGQVQVIFNCAVYTEGTDLPATSCLLMCKPTKSDLCYTQMLGRGLRTYPGKQSCTVIDFVPEDSRNVIMAGDVLGKPRQQKKAEAKAIRKGVIIESFGIDSEGNGIDGNPDEVQMKVLDYLSSSKLAWTFEGKMATVAVGEEKNLVILLPNEEQVRKGLAQKQFYPKQWTEAKEKLLEKSSSYSVYAIDNKRVIFLGREKDWLLANLLAGDWVSENGEAVLNERKKAWRRTAASAKQKEFLKRYGKWVDGMSKGTAAQAMTMLTCTWALRRAGVL